MRALNRVLVLDSLFDDLSVESAAAAARGWTLERVDANRGLLPPAEVVVHVRTQVDGALLDRLSGCRVVGRFGTGLDTVDQQAAFDRGVKVVGVRDFCTPELTAHTLGLAFVMGRRIDACIDGRLTADWSWQDVAANMPISPRREAAVIGFGTIGTAITRALVAMGVSVKVVTKQSEQLVRATGAEVASLDLAVREASLVFLHAALNSETAGLVDRPLLAGMSDSTILVNTARIGLFDEAAVSEAIHAERVGGVAIDARLAPDSPLREHLGDPRLLVSPHIGWYSERSASVLRTRTIEESIDAAERPHWSAGADSGDS